MILESKGSQEKGEEISVINKIKSNMSTSQRKESSYSKNHLKIAHTLG
jgi:hypothetical protein